MGGKMTPERKLINKLAKALRLMLSDYRTEGCSRPFCGTCQRSDAATAAAREALAVVEKGALGL
jgi:hypothetical protein